MIFVSLLTTFKNCNNLWGTLNWRSLKQTTSIIALNWLEPKPTNYNQISDTHGISKAPRLLP